MIKEAYCSFEIAKLLNKKGFDEPLFEFYDDTGKVLYSRHSKRLKISELDNELDNYYPHITHQMAMAWLREKNIGITPEVHITQDPKDYYWSAIIYYLDKSWDVLQYVSEPSKNVIDGYDGVIEQALKYVLEKLI